MRSMGISCFCGIVLFVAFFAIGQTGSAPASFPTSVAATTAAAGSAVAQPASPVKLGPNASLGGRRPFPDNNPWNQDISGERVDPKSDVYVATIGRDTEVHADWGKYNAMPYYVVSGHQPRVPISCEMADESDPGPYPIPPEALIESQLPGGPDPRTGDRHVLVIDRDNWVLYELFASVRVDGGKSWRCGSSARFDLNTNRMMGPWTWTSADAAGFPIFPGLVRGDEVFDLKEIRHAVRFTCMRTRRAFTSPATHWDGETTDPKAPPMGMRVRLKANYDMSGFPQPTQVVLTALKKYGMMLSDTGGDWYITGSPDERWTNEAVTAITKVKGHDLEVTFMEFIIADPRPYVEPTSAPAR